MDEKGMWMGRETVLPFDRGSVFYDGTMTEPQLNHPEGIAIDKDGYIWCGGEKGEIYRIDPDGSSMIQVASTGGFTLGLTFDEDGMLYTCDLKHQCVFRLNPANGELIRFAEGNGRGQNIRVPNVPVVDLQRGCLYVSDSFDTKEAGPGIWRFDLKSGQGDLWYADALRFANGIVLSPEGDALFVAETFKQSIGRIPILADGSAGAIEPVVQIDALPDGLTMDSNGRLYICCYEPSLIYRLTGMEKLELVYYDPTAHMLCHPTNGAFRGDDLFVSNLGRWHITKIQGIL